LSIISKLRKKIKRKGNPFLTSEKRYELELQRRAKESIELRGEAVKQHNLAISLRKRVNRSTEFIEGCVASRKKLSPTQQETLQKNLWELNEKLTNFVMGESRVMMEKELFPSSKIRLQNAFDMKERLEEKTKSLEKLGLVKSGFVSSTFYIKKPIRP